MALVTLILAGGAALLGGSFLDFSLRGRRRGQEEPDEDDDPASGAGLRPLSRLLPRGERERLDPREADRELNQLLAVSIASLTAGALARLVYPPLGLLAALGTAYATIPVWRDAWQSLARERRVDFYVLYSVAQVLLLAGGMIFLSALDNALFYAAEKLANRTRDHAREGLTSAFTAQPRTAFLALEGEVVVEVPIERVEVGHRVVISAGQTVPIDGRVASGSALVDQHGLTGESKPAPKDVGSEVFAGTIVIEGELYVDVSKTGEDTTAARLAEILERTTSYLSGVQLQGSALADRSALPLLALSLAAAPFVGYAGATAVLFSGIGDTVRITAPLTLLRHLQLASEAGILIKDGRSLELLQGVDTFVFDKTGTLTCDLPGVAALRPVLGEQEDRLLALAAAAERSQPHPLARALVEAAERRGLILANAAHPRCVLGLGVEATIDGEVIRVGSRRFLLQAGVDVPDAAASGDAEELYTTVFVAANGRFLGAIDLRPVLRPEAATVVEALRRRGHSIVILSGDLLGPTQRLADELGIDRVFAETLPEQKAEIIDQLREEGRTVCFVGDGINDAVALKRASVSVSLSGASNMAVDAAGIILLDGSLRGLPVLVAHAERFTASMRSNLALSVAPGVGIVSGVLLLHLGILGAIAIYNLGLVVAVANVLLRDRRDDAAVAGAPLMIGPPTAEG